VVDSKDVIIKSVPDVFTIATNHTYPPGNDMIFEEYFKNNFLNLNHQSDRIYLPILWTNFYISRNYGNSDMSDIQLFLDNLPRDKKYFTIVQWDDGILNDLKDLDIKIYSSGGVGDYAIPLINRPHDMINRDRDIFASFIGVINGRHRIRERLRDSLTNKDGYFISETCGFTKFKEVMERSIFSLCPRGYGKTSFRINESLNLGSIPVYIYDDPWIPFNDLVDFEEYGILIPENEIDNIDNILKNIPKEKLIILQNKGREVYRDYFTYEGCFNKILQKL